MAGEEIPFGDETRAFLNGLKAARDGSHSDLEARTFSTIIRAAMDMHRLNSVAFDMKKYNLRASENMEHRKIKVALINRQRRDIAEPRAQPDKLSDRMLKWESTNLTCTLAVNPYAKRDYQYSFDGWCEEIIAAIRQAADERANIISLGEFDYPPTFPADIDKQEFDNRIKACIDSFEHPIVLFAGSSHICNALPGTYRGTNVTEFYAANVGNVFFNEKILSGMLKANGELAQKIYKRTPALKVGERLSRTESIHYSSGFTTVVGRIAFLICADAYDPAILFDIYQQSSLEENRPQIILVPAYNRSQKLARMCQVLSLLTESIVMLLDVCEEVSFGSKQATQVWNCGVEGDTPGLAKLPDLRLARSGTIHSWDLDWDKVESFRTQHVASRDLPLFDLARKMAAPREREPAF